MSILYLLFWHLEDDSNNNLKNLTNTHRARLKNVIIIKTNYIAKLDCMFCFTKTAEL